MKMQNLGEAVFSLPREVTVRVLADIASNLHGVRRDKLLLEAAVGGYFLPEHETRQRSLVTDSEATKKKQREGNERARQRRAEEDRLVKADRARREELEAFWQQHNAQPGGHAGSVGGPASKGVAGDKQGNH